MGLDHEHSLNRDEDSVSRLQRIFVRALEHDLRRVSGLVGDLARARDLDRALVARDLGLGHSLDYALDIDRSHGFDLAEVRVLARSMDPELNRELRQVAVCALELAGALNSASTIQGRHDTARVAPAARRLAGMAARLLPVQERARYAEEFASELWEIAQTGGGRRPQLAYAARHVLAARRLRAPQRRGAVP